MKLTPAELLRGLSDVVFPPTCVHCRGLIENETANHATGVRATDGNATTDGQSHAIASGAKLALRHVCPRCVAQIDFIRPPACRTCGHPFYGEVDADVERLCPHCEGLDPAFGEGRAAVLFKGPARALVLELKYHRGLHVVADMREIFRASAHVLEHVRGAQLVPVPLHARRARERGYNQAQLLAEALVEIAGGDTRVAPILRREVDTQTQTAFDRRTRLANLKNAFALAPGADLNPALHYILVDDVFTTGSTLNSCARALRRGGAVNIDVVTFGHG